MVDLLFFLCLGQSWLCSWFVLTVFSQFLPFGFLLLVGVYLFLQRHVVEVVLFLLPLCGVFLRSLGSLEQGLLLCLKGGVILYGSWSSRDGVLLWIIFLNWSVFSRKISSFSISFLLVLFGLVWTSGHTLLVSFWLYPGCLWLMNVVLNTQSHYYLDLFLLGTLGNSWGQ